MKEFLGILDYSTFSALIGHQTVNHNEIKICLEYLILGIIQGLTEFLPISSTAHLKAIPMLLEWDDPGLSISAILQLGSIIAVITYFKKDLFNILKGITKAFGRKEWQEKNARLGLAVVAGTIPILITGLCIKIFWADFQNSNLRSITSIGLVSIFMALLLAIGERKGRQRKSLKNVSIKDGLIIGFGQILALIPGASRSGVTLTASLLNGWKRQDAARFSFLLGIPAITTAGLAEIRNTSQIANEIGFLPIFIGISSSAIVSWLAIDWLLKYLQRNSTWLFIMYRLIFGIVLIFWWKGIK